MQYIYILRYTCADFELVKKPIIKVEDINLYAGYMNSDSPQYITYLLDEKGTTNIVRSTKINRVTKLGDMTYIGYFTDKTLYPKIKAEMCDKIDLAIRKQEQMLNHSKKQYNEFLYSKLGESL